MHKEKSYVFKNSKFFILIINLMEKIIRDLHLRKNVAIMGIKNRLANFL
jgi:hypothetical protein